MNWFQPSEWVYRTGIGILLAAYLAVLAFCRPVRTVSAEQERRGLAWTGDELLAILFLAGPLCWYLYSPRSFYLFRLPWVPGVRLAAWGLAGATLVLLGYTRRADRDGAGDELAGWSERGPYRHRRYPDLAANCLFFLFATGVSANWPIVMSSILGSVIMRLIVATRLDARRLMRFGSRYADYMQRTGCFFWKITPPNEQYVVPHRFGMSSLLALLTIFALLFGWFRYLEMSAVVYWFTASEITVICLAQILFGRSPRGASIVGGALLLPIWGMVGILSSSTIFSLFFLISFVIALAVLGGIVGYCVGTIAAGFFLVVDVIDQYLPGGHSMTAQQTSPQNRISGTSLPDSSHPPVR